MWGSETRGEADGRDVARNQGAPGTLRHWKRHWERQEGPSSRASGGSMAPPTPGFQTPGLQECTPVGSSGPGKGRSAQTRACSYCAPSLLVLLTASLELHEEYHTFTGTGPTLQCSLLTLADASFSISKMASSRNVLGVTRKLQAKPGSAPPGCWVQHDCAGPALGPPVRSPSPRHTAGWGLWPPQG